MSEASYHGGSSCQTSCEDHTKCNSPQFVCRPGVIDRFNPEVRQISRDILHLCFHEGFAFVVAAQELLRDPVCKLLL